MKKSLKFVNYAILTIMLIFSLTIPANAATDSTDYTVSVPTEQIGASIDFIDENLVEKGVSTYAAIREVYSHSKYVYLSSSITSFDVGPRNSDIFLISVAKGASVSLQSNKTVSGSVQFDASVSTPLKTVLNKGLGLSVSGSFSHTFSKTKVYSGPTGNYNTRSYYGAINYDIRSSTVAVYEVYDVYVGSVFSHTITKSAPNKVIKNIKVPKAVEYSRDANI